MFRLAITTAELPGWRAEGVLPGELVGATLGSGFRVAAQRPHHERGSSYP